MGGKTSDYRIMISRLTVSMRELTIK